MNLYFVQEAVYFEFKGNYYSPRIRYETYWERYLNHFNSVHVFARVKQIDELPNHYHQVNGDKVSFITLPYYNGIIGFYKSKKQITKIYKNNISYNDAYVLRIPGPLGNLIAQILNNNKVKYAVEVVGDPYEVAKFLNLPRLLKLLLKNYSLLKMRKVVANSVAALYVTNETLQRRYPAKKASISSSASNVIIDEKDIVDLNRKLKQVKQINDRFTNVNKKPIKIGVLGMMYAIKSPIEILEVINNLIKNKYNIELYFAGEGPLKSVVEKKALEYNISENVKCLGNLSSGEAVYDFLDSLDLYVQFSKTEGIPRAMLEAMARGCPVVSSDAGGIPEFVSSKFLVKTGDIEDLFIKIEAILTNENLYRQNIEQSIKTVNNFSLTVLKKKRYKHYSEVYNIFKNNI